MTWREAEETYEHDFIREETLPRMFERSAAQRPDEPAQMYKGGVYERSLVPDVVSAAPDGDFAELTYGEMRTIVRNLAAGFREVGLTDRDRIAIYASTRMEWAQSDFAILAAGGVVTTIYTSSSPAQVQYLLSDPGASGVVVENEELLENVLAVRDAIDLRFVVVIDELEGDYPDDVYSLREVHELGRQQFDLDEYESWLDDVDPEDLATIVYTSGTTGQPKGVMLTHQNIRANCNQVFRRLGPRPDKDDDAFVLDGDHTGLSMLPLAHIYERTAGHFLNFGVGGCIAYAESPDTLQEEFPLVQPEVVNSVPRLFERIYDGIRQQASESDTKQRIFEWATAVGRRYHEADRPGPMLRTKRWLADKLVFKKVHEGLGGNVELFTSGGGTLSPDLCALYHGMGLPIYEGYGATETAPIVTTNPQEEPKVGTIGPPLPGVEVKVDLTVVPEGELSKTMGDVGELLVKGENVFEGYWNKPEETEAAIEEDDDGRWFRTGDIVTIRPDGYLVFHERAKQMLVLDTGKNVAPAPIEDAFSESDVVEQVMIVGDDRKFVGALIVPNFEGLRRWADRSGVDLPEDPEAICEHHAVRERIGREVESVNEPFEKHERIGDFRLIPVEFTEENDLLTPSLKKKRRNIRDRFGEEIESIYAETEERPAEAATDD